VTLLKSSFVSVITLSVNRLEDNIISRIYHMLTCDNLDRFDYSVCRIECWSTASPASDKIKVTTSNMANLPFIYSQYHNYII
jgi:hypothetical protein